MTLPNGVVPLGKMVRATEPVYKQIVDRAKKEFNCTHVSRVYRIEENRYSVKCFIAKDGDRLPIGIFEIVLKAQGET